ncbi:hypothetical protein EXE48_12365 [Halorubrum sp. ASP1]|uniref:hypothetical protein n=1 Tax=Halorubrum sp. ASP1 TaxID=2518114 RepID=UPI0010F67FBD|nr:hypothetical protein [Halorubrum sp. ASP1]TKX60759.1 hypothetical protein EXE48_12365 [Halorubrum sp. ASP1]
MGDSPSSDSDQSEQPWEQTEAGFRAPVTKSAVEQAIDLPGIGVTSGGLFCHNLDCEKADREMKVQATTRLADLLESPHPVDEDLEEELREKSTEKVPHEAHDVYEGDIWYFSIGPVPDEGEVKIGGWYCSPECVDSVPSLSAEHLTVAASMGYPGYPDVRTGTTPPVVDEVKGVYADPMD